MTPPSLKRSIGASMPRDKISKSFLYKNDAPQTTTSESEFVVYAGELDYDKTISRFAYTSYLNIAMLKNRVSIKLIEPTKLKRKVKINLTHP